MKNLNTKLTRLRKRLGSAAVVMLTIGWMSPAFAAGSVSFLDPADGTVFPVGTVVNPDGVANAAASNSNALDLVLVLDSSGSFNSGVDLDGDGTNDISRRALQQQAAAALVNNLPVATTNVSIVEFDSNANVVQPLVPLDTGLADVLAAIASVDANGGTDIRDGVVAADAELDANARTASNRQILLISDGDSSERLAVEAALAAAADGTVVSTVGFPGADSTTLSAIAAAGGGTFTDLATNPSIALDVFGGGAGGALVGVSSVFVTDPNGQTLEVAVSAFGNFEVGNFAIQAGANVFIAETTFTDGSTETATLTLFGDTGTTTPVVQDPNAVPLPASGILLGAALFGLTMRRRRRAS